MWSLSFSIFLPTLCTYFCFLYSMPLTQCLWHWSGLNSFKLPRATDGSQDKVVSIMTRLWAEQPGVQILAGQEIFLFSTMSRLTMQPIELSIHWVPGRFPRVKWPEHEVDHLIPSSAEVKNEWSYNSTPPVCLHGVDVNNCTFWLGIDTFCFMDWGIPDIKACFRITPQCERQLLYICGLLNFRVLFLHQLTLIQMSEYCVYITWTAGVGGFKLFSTLYMLGGGSVKLSTDRSTSSSLCCLRSKSCTQML